MGYTDKLITRIATVNSSLCVGVDPDPQLYSLLTANMAKTWSFGVIDALAPYSAAFKFQLAFFQRFGPDGLSILREAVELAKDAGAVTILDAKFSDIPNTFNAYLETSLGQLTPSMFAWGVDAVTVNPYVALEGVKSASVTWRNTNNAIYLVMSPNVLSKSTLLVSTQRALNTATLQMMAEVASWNNQKSLALGFVTSALNPDILVESYEKHPQIPLLIPGIGFQGGVMNSVDFALSHGKANLVVVARALYAGSNAIVEPDKLRERAKQFKHLSNST